MRIEDQVTSLEISKRLKELGVKQESLHYWCNFGKDDWRGIYNRRSVDEDIWVGYQEMRHEFRLNYDCFDYCSAFTVAELGEMLPPYVMSHKVGTSWFICIRFGGTLSNYRDLDEPIIIELTNEANGRGKMLIWYLENKDSMRPEFQNQLLTLTKDI